VTTNVEAGAAAGHGAKAAVISVDPSVTHPGGSIDLRTFADCGAGGPGSITSPAFAGSVPLTTATDGGLYAEGPVARDTKPGTYPVLELCGSKAVAAGTVTVVRAVAPETGGGWGATREAAALTGAGTLPGGAAGSGALALTGAAALSGLYYLLRRRLFTAVGRDVGRG
jgi:hypothetical protein